jgi:EpsD family peptidyl-prolyl cis-trans isomerase
MKEGKSMALLAMATGVALGIFGCSKIGTTTPTQLAAKMGSDEVTLYEVDRAVTRLPAMAASDAAGMRKRVVDELIDRHLMADEAIKSKLDRLPDTVSDVEVCRLSVLQNAYLMSIAAQPAGNARPGKADAQNYYEHHPQLFSDRKIYWLKEIVFPENVGINVAEAEKVSPTALLALLEQRGVKYRTTFGPAAAEDLPPEVLDAMGSLEDGRSKVLNVSGSVVVLVRVSASPAPVGLQTAEPGILEYLGHQETDERLHAQVGALRSKAGVQYMNGFAPTTIASDAGQGGASATAATVVKQ